MKHTLLNALLMTALSPAACAQPKVDCDVYPEQTASPYVLPYEKGASFNVVVARGHYRKANQGVGLYAVDFEMPIGTKIVAARAGQVVAVREHYQDWNGKDLEENFIFVRHEDGTVARYFHLTHDGALVKEGDTVDAGEVIGLSGNTGQSGGPHLHFDVQKCGPNLPPNYNQLPCGETVPVTFKNTTAHQCGVIEGRHYKAV